MKRKLFPISEISESILNHIGWSYMEMQTNVAKAPSRILKNLMFMSLLVLLGIMPVLTMAEPYGHKGGECGHENYSDNYYVLSWDQGSSSYSNEGSENLFDSKSGTKWFSDFSEDNKPYVIFHFGGDVRLVSYTLTTANDTYENSGRNWTAWTIYGGNSLNGTWTQVDKKENQTLHDANFTVSDIFEVDGTNTTAYQYYKLEIDAVEEGNLQQMADIHFNVACSGGHVHGTEENPHVDGNNDEYCDLRGIFIISPAPQVDGVYQISNAGNLYWFAALVNGDKTIIGEDVQQNSSANAKLMNDIAVNEGYSFHADGTYTGEGSPKTWTPIGLFSKPFKGTFQGNNHTISGVYINGNDNNQGLFGYVRGGTIEGIGVVNSYIGGNDNVGGIVGYFYGGSISNSYYAGTVNASGNAGGIAGSVYSGVSITNSYNVGTVTGSSNVGGVSGYVNKEVTITNSYNVGTVTGSSTNVGGISGYIYNKGSITSSYNVGAVTGSSNVGGVSGYVNTEVTITNSYNVGTVTGSSTNVGGISGYIYKGSITNSYNVGNVSGSSYVGGVYGNLQGNNTITNCYYDKQMCPIELAEGVIGVTASLTTGMTGAVLQGADKLGDDETWVFTDGLYPRLNNMHETDLAKVYAMPVFLYMSDEAFETIDNVYCSFDISSIEGFSWNSSESITLPTSGTTASISQSDENAFVTVGKNGNVYKTINLNVNVLDITISLSDNVLCYGDNVTLTATLLDGAAYSWSKGTEVLQNETSNVLSLTNCTETATYTVTVSYHNCEKSASQQVVVNPLPEIAIIGNGATVYEGQSYTLEASTDDSGCSYQWKFGDDVIQDATSLTYTIPKVDSEDEGNYSVVITNNETNCSNNSGNFYLDVMSPEITISTAEELQSFAKAINGEVEGDDEYAYTYYYYNVEITVSLADGCEGKTINLTQNINLNEGVTFTFIPDNGLVEVKNNDNIIGYLGTGVKGDVTGDNTTFDTEASVVGAIYASDDSNTPVTSGVVFDAFSSLNAWTSIGTAENPFKGSFEGSKYSISGLYANNGNDSQGLFGNVENPYIRQVTVENSYIKANNNVGGIVGNVINVESPSSSTIDSCYNKSVVCGSGNGVGGIVGNASTLHVLSNSNNIGVVSGNDNVGGLVGNATTLKTVNINYNAGTVCGKGGNVGGLIGNVGTVEVTLNNVFNSGMVSGAGNNVGGLLGSVSTLPTLNNSYNVGIVNGTNYAGGLIGNIASSITSLTDCYNAADVSGSSNVGAIFGAGTVSSITNVFYDKQMCSATQDGITGKLTSEMIGNKLFDDVVWKRIDGMYPYLSSMQTDDAEVSAIPVLLYMSEEAFETIDNVYCSFGISSIDGYDWKSSESITLPTSGTEATISQSDENAFVTVGKNGNVYKTINLNVNVLDITISLSDNVLCYGDNVTLTATLLDGAAYSWSKGTEVLQNETSNVLSLTNCTETATYTVTVSYHNCEKSASQEVVVNPLPIVIVQGEVDIFNEQSTTVLTATGADSYVWMSGDEIISTEATVEVGEGVYTVIGTNSNDCSSTETVEVTHTITEHLLTVEYVYEDGSMAAETYEITLQSGDSYNVVSPLIDCYTADSLVVRGVIYEDIEEVVTYTENEPLITEFDAVACDEYTWNDSTYTESGVYEQEFKTIHGCDSIVTLYLTINNSVISEFDAIACDEYTWNEVTYTESGDYVQEFETIHGCDSIVTLHLTIYNSVTTEFDAESCDEYTWNDVTYYESGEYEQVFDAANGCDSIVTLHLTIHNSVETEFDAESCDEYTWNDTTYTESGEYVQEFETIHGCDSIVTLHLTINNSVTSEFDAEACDEYTWNDVTYTESGEYVQEFETIHGCDSIVTLQLTINNSVTSEFDVEACDEYTWNDSTYTESGEYEQEFKTIHGCDSIVTLHLTINNSVISEFDAIACDEYTWSEVTYTESGDYVQEFETIHGCDSIVTLHLTIYNSVTTEFDAESCDEYTWNDVTYYESGEYEQEFKTIHGCDSIVTLHLTINNSVISEFDAIACDEYTWSEVTYTESGDYVQEFETIHGCDSIVTLHLTIYNSVTTEFDAESCDEYTWNDVTYYESGEYVQEFETIHGCDSIVTLHLTIYNSVETEFDAESCDEYTWNDVTYTESGEYVQEFETIHGCDSIVTLHLTIYNSVETEFDAESCDEYTWNDVTYYESGEYVQEFETIYGCDSIVTLHLTINNSVTSEFDAEACDEYTWNDVTYTESGDYVQEFETIHGCDSIVTLHLTIHNSVTTEFDVEACDEYTWNDVTYTESGDYVQEFETIHGCDSIVTLHLTINNSVTSEFDAEACDEYTWNDVTYTESGDYVQEFETIHGCDSIVTLHLTIHNSVTTEFDVEACDEYTWNDVTYTESGDYVQEFETIHGCDSIVTLHLTINNSVTSEFDAEACDEYTWNDVTYTESGDYVQEFETIHGCDSIVTLHLTIHNSVTTEFDAVACDEYIWNEVVYTESGEYVQKFETIHGCDSIVTLHLTITESVTTEFGAIACDEYTWNNVTYTESGEYEQVFDAANGCDSIVTLFLTINNSVTTEFDAVACDEYIWNEVVYTESGVYEQEFKTIHGCDSIVTLFLTINNSVTTEFDAVACDEYTWNEVVYTESGVYEQEFKTIHGCDSIVTLHLTINNSVTNEFDAVACDEYIWNEVVYTESGVYEQEFKTIHGCDSIVTLFLTINNSVTTEFDAVACDEYTWNEVTYTESGEYVQEFETIHGCDSIVTLHLTINESVTTEFDAIACDEYTWNNVTYTESGEYVQEFATIHGCDSIVTLYLTIHNSVYNEFDASACDRYVWNDVTYYESGDYVQEFATIHGCDSIVTLHLTITNSIIHEFDAIACNEYIWNGETYTESGDYLQIFDVPGICDSIVILHLTLGNCTQDLVINNSWTWVSSYMNSELIVSEIFEDSGLPWTTTGDISVVQSPEDGNYCTLIAIPGTNMQFQWDYRRGYQVFSTSEDELIMSVEGISLKDSEKRLEIAEGWSMIPILVEYSVNASAIMAMMPEAAVVAGDKGETAVRVGEDLIVGSFTMEPGKGYYLYAEDETLLDYNNAVEAKSTADYAWMIDGITPVTTNNMQVVYATDDAMEVFEYGDIMIAVNSEGVVVGAQQYTGNGIAMQVYGEDVAHNLPGYATGEVMSFKLYRPSTDETFAIEYSVQNESERNYTPFGMTRILGVKSAEGIEDLSTAISIYPNPTRGTSRITGDAIERIQVLNSVGAVLHDYTMPTAVSYYDIDMSNYGKGTYIIYITTKHGTTSHKLVKM